jgi:bifunctional non-homologous end joining protein LigD
VTDDLDEIGKLTKVKLKNLDKCFYPDAGVTKAHVIEYYVTLAPKILPIVKDRPLVLTRYPDGIKDAQLGKTSFFEKNAPEAPQHGSNYTQSIHPLQKEM